MFYYYWSSEDEWWFCGVKDDYVSLVKLKEKIYKTDILRFVFFFGMTRKN